MQDQDRVIWDTEEPHDRIFHKRKFESGINQREASDGRQFAGTNDNDPGREHRMKSFKTSPILWNLIDIRVMSAVFGVEENDFVMGVQKSMYDLSGTSVDIEQTSIQPVV